MLGRKGGRRFNLDQIQGPSSFTRKRHYTLIRLPLIEVCLTSAAMGQIEGFAYLQRSQRQHAFLKRLRALCQWHDGDHQLTLTLLALQACATDLNDEIWREADAAAGERRDPAVAQAWKALLATRRSVAAATVRAGRTGR